MRGYAYYRIKRSILFLLAVCAAGYAAACCYPGWIRHYVENKVSEFLGNRLDVEIGDVSGGIFNNMILRDVAVISGQGREGKIFRLKRMEVSCHVWRIIAEKLGFNSDNKKPAALDYVGIYFSDNNPFARGFIKFYRDTEKIGVTGYVSPVLFDEERKSVIKGTLVKRPDGNYNCDFVWDGRNSIKGELYPLKKKAVLNYSPLLLPGNTVTVKLEAVIDDEKGVQIYTRLDKADLFGMETIGDIWFSYRYSDIPLFSVRAENLMVNKRPFYGLDIKGGFIPGESVIFLDSAKWGTDFILSGKIGTAEPYPVQAKLSFTNVDLSDIAFMFGNKRGNIAGNAEGEMKIEGPFETSDLKGRLFVGEGFLGDLQFRSISASLKGKMPVIRIADSRVVKDKGQIYIDGEIDMSKFKSGHAFDDLAFATDNKVAVWEKWQISKEDGSQLVEASKDRVTISTLMEEDTPVKNAGTGESARKELGFKYKIDTNNSLKMEFDEENDFVGMEHKIEF
ncbi:MAG: hypothetical protein ABH883_06685 [Candidatus Omnitrophota bacterium]